MVRPAVRREVVFHLQKVYDIGERRACKATGFHRSSQRYKSRGDPQTELRIRLKDLAASRVRYGRITKRGSPWLRWALVEAAMHGTKRTDRVGRWGRRLALRKGALKARVALARVLCAESHARWPRNG